MAILELKKERAIEAYNTGDAVTKKLLEALFPEQFKKNIFDITTMSDVFESLGLDAKDYTINDSWSNEEKAAMHFKRLKLMQQVFNGDWKANLADITQYKYYPWFKIIPDSQSKGMSNPSGFGLSYYVCGYDYSGTALGVRLYYRTSDIAIHVGKHFIHDYTMWANYEQLINQ